MKLKEIKLLLASTLILKLDTWDIKKLIKHIKTHNTKISEIKKRELFVCFISFFNSLNTQ